MKKRFLSMLVLLAAVVSGAMAADGIECSASDIGKVICTDGSIYENVSAATTAGKTAVAMIAYIDMENKNGLALALSDEGSMTWSAAIAACEDNSAVAGGTWVLPSKEQWETMGALDSNADAATALRDGFSSVGGTNMQSGAYWSSTANDANADKAWRYNFTTGFYWENNVNKTVNNYVRACLTFNILVAPPTYSVTLADGTEDADKWTISPKSEGLSENEVVTVTYNGEKKVKSVKAVKKGAATIPVTSITLNKTETSIEVGSTETLSVTEVAPDNATDKTYTWKTSDASKATVDQDGKVTAVAAGTVTIYAEANDGSGVKGNCTVTVTPATITVTINQSDWGMESLTKGSFTKDGVTVSAGDIDPINGNLMNNGTFSTTLGNFTKIVVTAKDINVSGTDWSGNSSSMTWAGTPASTVSFSGNVNGHGQTQTTIVCTIVPTN